MNLLKACIFQNGLSEKPKYHTYVGEYIEKLIDLYGHWVEPWHTCVSDENLALMEKNWQMYSQVYEVYTIKLYIL